MKVLLGVGGGEDSLRAAERTVARTRETDDDLTIAVLRNPDSDRDPPEIEERLDELLADAGLEADRRRVEGDPGSRLVEIAEREGFDEIVIGGGQRSPMGKIRLGSITEFVLLNAKVTVTLVR